MASTQFVREGSQKKSFTPLPGSPADYTDQVVLYRNHDAVNAINERRDKGLNPFVFWVEGEKCAETLWGLPACCHRIPERMEQPAGSALVEIRRSVRRLRSPDDGKGIQYVNDVAELYPDNPKKWVRCYPERPELLEWQVPRPNTGAGCC